MSYIRLEEGKDGIVELIFDQPGKSVNVMGEEYDTAMKEAIAELEERREQIRGVYLRSGKPGQFFAGGDVKAMLEMDQHPDARTRRQMFEGILAAKQPLRRLETLGVPVAVGINGTALGGGYEICLACHYRVALDQPEMRLGLPESQLGLMPGAGGVVRLTRLLGLQAAFTLISQGRRLRPAQALEKGLVHALAADEEEMHRLAREWIKSHPDAVQPWDEKDYRIPGGAPGDDALQGFLYLGPVNVMNHTHGKMPAQKAIFAAVHDTARVDFAAAEKVEARYFLHLLLDQTARNMMTAFFVQMNAVNNGASRPQDIPPCEFRKIGVLGAGLMGASIALVGAKAGLEVVLKDRDRAAAEKGRDYSRTACEKDRRIDEQQAQQILSRIHVTEDAADFADCDVVIEAVFENREVKAEVTRDVAPHLGENAVFASNTSALPITELAQASPQPHKFIGMHFFSPAEKMPLVEIICGEKTDDQALAMVFDLSRRMGKTPIVVHDGPGFFTSRVIGKLIGQSMRMLTEGVPPALIENAALQAGCPVGPLALLDEITQQTSREAMEQARLDAEARGEKFEEPPESILIKRMVDEHGRRGKIHGGGFYEYPEKGKKHIWPPLQEMYADGPHRDIPLQDVQDRLLFAEALEAVRAMEQGIIDSVADGNIGSIMGIGFPAHTGGVYQFINARGVEAFVARCKELQARYGEEFAPPALLQKKAKQGEIFA